MNAISYALAEALATLRRTSRGAAMSIATIAIAFLTLGGFLLVSANMREVVERWAAAAELSIYLRDDVDPEAREALRGEVAGQAAVASVEYVSREVARERFRADFPELADLVRPSDNPFPASLEVRLRDGETADAAASLAQMVASRPEVMDVRYDRQWLDRLLGLLRTVRIAGLTVTGILVLGAAFTVTAIVRLSLEARRDELEIMELVGAPFSFIRGPSVAEGTLLGGIGALVALIALWVTFASARGPLGEALQAWGSVGGLRFLSPSEAMMLVFAGLVVGALSGYAAARARG
jgi:cell division transport system permease protein